MGWTFKADGICEFRLYGKTPTYTPEVVTRSTHNTQLRYGSFLSSTLRLLLSELLVTTSIAPSPLRSAEAIRHAPGPTGIDAAGLNAPRPSPNSTRRLSPLVATTSILRSRSTSAM